MMDSKDYFHHSFHAAADDVGIFPEDQSSDRRLGFDSPKRYMGLQTNYNNHIPYETNGWDDHFLNKANYAQHFLPNNTQRQENSFYGNSQLDHFDQCVGRDFAPISASSTKQSNKLDDFGMNSINDPMGQFYPPTMGYHQEMNIPQKPLHRPNTNQSSMYSNYAPQPPQMMQNRNMNGMNNNINGMSNNMNGMNRGMALSYPNAGMNGGINPYMMHGPGSQMGMPMAPFSGSTGGSNAQGRAINKMLLDILRDRVIDPQRLDMAVDTYVERMDCVNLATLLFHTGKKRILLLPAYIKRVAQRFLSVKEELRAREASNALYGLKCMTSELMEVRELVYAIATKLGTSSTDFVAQAVGNALYGLQMMTSDHEEVRYLLTMIATKVSRCTELLEAQNVGNALYGLRNMNSDYREVRAVIAALTPRIATAREDLNGQALGNSLYGLQSMCSKESEVRFLLAVLATKVTRTWEDLKAQEVGNALYGLKRMSTDVSEVRMLISALVPKVATSPEILDAQAIGNSFYGFQNMRSDNPEVLSLLAVMADKVIMSCPELDGQAMGNSLYGLQGMSSDHPEVRAVVNALTTKIQSSCLDMNAQEMGNALFGLQNMTSEHADVRRLLTALTHKVNSSKHDLASQEIGNAMFGLQGMSSSVWETRMLIRQIAMKIQQSHCLIDPLGIANSLFGLQRMSSESEDVRLLVQSLAIKIEQSWKQLSAQHISNSLFGLQNLSSAESEVRYLLKSILPKITACRDELTAKQLSQAIFGMHSFSSEHAEVLSLAAALAEKVSFSSESWTLNQLAMVLFGLQGFSSTKDEVAILLNAVANKATSLLTEKYVDVNALANCLFGFQRMNSNNADVCRILSVLLVKMTNVSPSVTVSAKMCSNMIFGVQGLSCTNETVKTVLYHIADYIQQVSSKFLTSPRNSPHEIYGLDKTGELMIPSDRIEDIVALYQATTLSLFAMRDLETDPDLQARMFAELSALRSILDVHKDDIPPPAQSLTEKRMARELADVLAHEPFQVITGVVVQGFEMSTYVQLYPNLQLKTAAGNVWAPVLNLEVRGSSYSFPAKELFYRLRRHFLEQERGISVDTVPAESFRTDGQQGLRIHSAVLSPLYPPSMEDATTFSKRLQTLNKSGQLNSGYPSSECFFSFSGGPSLDHVLEFTQSSMPPLEYYDDDFKRSPNCNYSENNKKYKVSVNSRSPKVPMGMPLSWVGDWPTVTPTASSVTVAALTGVNTQQLQSRSMPSPSTISARNPELAFTVQSTNNSNGSGNLLLGPHMNMGLNGSSLNSSLNSGLGGGLHGNSLGHAAHLSGDHFSLGGPVLYQNELNAESSRSPSLNVNNSVNGSSAVARSLGLHSDEGSDLSSSGSPSRSRLQSGHSGGADAFSLSAGNFGESRYGLSLPPINTVSNKDSSSTDCGAGSTSHTIVLDFAVTPSNSYGLKTANSSSLSILTGVSSMTPNPKEEVTASKHSTTNGATSRDTNNESDDNSEEVDVEIAALEAQLEVARLEARIKELKSKKATTSASVSAKTTELETA